MQCTSQVAESLHCKVGLLFQTSEMKYRLPRRPSNFDRYGRTGRQASWVVHPHTIPRSISQLIVNF